MELTVPRPEELYLFQGVPVWIVPLIFVRAEANVVPRACVLIRMRLLIRNKVGW